MERKFAVRYCLPDHIGYLLVDKKQCRKMRKFLLLVVSVVPLAVLMNIQQNIYACNVDKSFKHFVSILNTDENIIVISNDYDLSIKRLKVSCALSREVDGQLYYIAQQSISLKKNQVIFLPDGCFLFNETCSQLISTGSYKANNSIICYIANKKRGRYICPVTQEVVVPAGKQLKFKNGSVQNAVLRMSGSLIESTVKPIFRNSIITEIGNPIIHGRWFFDDGQNIVSEDIERYSNYTVDFDNLKLYSEDKLEVSNACWKNLCLTAPQILVGDNNYVIPGFSISKNDTKNKNHIVTDVNLSNFENYIVILSFGEHVHYDWREVNGRPTLYRGLSSIVRNASNGSFAIVDSVENFNREYQYTNSGKKVLKLSSTGYLLKPCKVIIDSCQFFSTKRFNPGFMYIYSGKDISLKNSSWIASPEGTPSLLSINYSVSGTVENCCFKGSYYEGTATSYGLQTFGSTRINVNKCIFEGNRRGLDFSGSLCQSRYCIVENCRVVGDIIKHTGSGLGGHSTSSHNIYRNNVIEGSSSCAGIQTRGEYEIVEGNVFDLSFSAAAVTCAENTIVRNNICKTPSNTFVWIESSSIKNNKIVVEKNTFRGGRLVRGQKILACDVIIKDNIFEYTSSLSSIAPVGDRVHITLQGNKILKGDDKAVLYYKYNETIDQPKAEGLSSGDVVDVRVERYSKKITLLGR